MNLEEKPLHEVILDVLFYENKEIPAYLSPNEIYWKIKDAKVTENKVREVLAWLVHHKRATLKAGKYQIDRYEFLDRLGKEDLAFPKSNGVPKLEMQQYDEKELENNIKERIIKGGRQRFSKLVFGGILLIATLLLCSIYFLREISFIEEELIIGGAHEEQEEIIDVNYLKNKRLYLSQAGDVLDKEKIQQIAYNFHLQNVINDTIKKNINLIYWKNKKFNEELNFTKGMLHRVISLEQKMLIAFLIVLLFFLLCLF